jgi:hypothetical protein
MFLFVEFLQPDGNPVSIQIANVNDFWESDTNETTIQYNSGETAEVAGSYDDTKRRLQQAGVTIV